MPRLRTAAVVSVKKKSSVGSHPGHPLSPSSRGSSSFDLADAIYQLDQLDQLYPETQLKAKGGLYHLHPLVIYHSKWFDTLVTIFIVLNALQMGIETDYPEFAEVYVITELIFTAVFSFEMFIKKFVLRCRYFMDGWNILDFFLVWMSIIDTLMGVILGNSSGMQSLSVLRILRLLRVVKMIRLLRAFKQLWLIVKGLLDSVKTIFWAFLLLVMIYYVFGIFFTQMIGRNLKAGYYRAIDEEPAGTIINYHPDFDSKQYFGNMMRSMFTLFETSLEPQDIRPIVEEQPFLFPFILLFIFVTTFGVMNVIIGVIVENTTAASKKSAQEVQMLEELKRVAFAEKLYRVITIIDADGDGLLTPSEISEAMENPEVASLTTDLKFPPGFSDEEFFDLLDTDGGGCIKTASMLRSLLRCVVHDVPQRLLDLKIGMHRAMSAARNCIPGMARCRNESIDGVCDLMNECCSLDDVFNHIDAGLAATHARLGGSDPLPPVEVQIAHRRTKSDCLKEAALDLGDDWKKMTTVISVKQNLLKFKKFKNDRGSALVLPTHPS